MNGKPHTSVRIQCVLVVMLLMLTVFLVACSKPSTPTEVVRQFYDAYTAGDGTQVARLVTGDKAAALTQGTQRMQSNLVRAQIAGTTVDYGAEVIEGDSARVRLIVTSPDLESIADQYFAAEEERWKSKPVDWHSRGWQPDAELVPGFLSAIADPESPKLEWEYEAHLRKERGEWRLLDLTPEP